MTPNQKAVLRLVLILGLGIVAVIVAKTFIRGPEAPPAQPTVVADPAPEQDSTPSISIEAVAASYYQIPFGTAWFNGPGADLTSVAAQPSHPHETARFPDNSGSKRRHNLFRMTALNNGTTPLRNVRVTVGAIPRANPSRAVVLWQPKSFLGGVEHTAVQLSRSTPAATIDVVSTLEAAQIAATSIDVELTEPGLYSLAFAVSYEGPDGGQATLDLQTHEVMVPDENAVLLVDRTGESTEGPTMAEVRRESFIEDVLEQSDEEYKKLTRTTQSKIKALSLTPPSAIDDRDAVIDFDGFEPSLARMFDGSLIREAVEKGPMGDSFPHLALGARREGDLITAEFLLQEHLAFYPTDASALADTLTFYRRSEDEGGVQETWLRMRGPEVVTTVHHFLAGASYAEHHGRTAEVRTYLASAIEQFPESIEALNLLRASGMDPSETIRAFVRACQVWQLLEEADRHRFRQLVVSNTLDYLEELDTSEFREYVTTLMDSCGYPIRTDLQMMPATWHAMPELIMPPLIVDIEDFDEEHYVAFMNSLLAHGNWKLAETHLLLRTDPSDAHEAVAKLFDIRLYAKDWERAVEVGRPLLAKMTDMKSAEILCIKYLIACYLAGREGCIGDVGYSITPDHVIQGSRINTPRLTALAGVFLAAELDSVELLLFSLVSLGLGDPWDYNGGVVITRWESDDVLRKLALMKESGEFDMKSARPHVETIMKLELEQILVDGDFLPDPEVLMIEHISGEGYSPTMEAIEIYDMMSLVSNEGDVHIVRVSDGWELQCVSEVGESLITTRAGKMMPSDCKSLVTEGPYCASLTHEQVVADIQTRVAADIVDGTFDVQKGMELAQAAVQLDPASPLAWYTLARFAMIEGRRGDCSSLLEKALALDAEHPRLRKLAQLCTEP
jgi:hypothetical protein